MVIDISNRLLFKLPNEMLNESGIKIFIRDTFTKDDILI